MGSILTLVMIMGSIMGNITLIMIMGSIMGNITLIMIIGSILKLKKVNFLQFIFRT